MEESVSWAKFGERSLKDYQWQLIQVSASINTHIDTGRDKGVQTDSLCLVCGNSVACVVGWGLTLCVVDVIVGE
jgi:hypothetical protein